MALNFHELLRLMGIPSKFEVIDWKYPQKVITKKIAITFRTFKVVEWSILYCSNESYSQRPAMAYRISKLLIDIHNCPHKFTVSLANDFRLAELKEGVKGI